MAMTVQELREALLSSGGYNEAEVKRMNKKILKERYEQLQQALTSLDNAEVVSEINVPKTNSTSPNPTDPEWTDYVLSHFKDYEMDNGNPKADGLRRVAERLLGPFDSETEVVQAPTLDSGATVTVRLTFRGNQGYAYNTVMGAADVSSANTARDFAVHAVATAETRAEGRALRKALRLTKVLTAEEMAGAEVDEPTGNDSRIPTSMINSLTLMCQKQQIDLGRLAKQQFQVDSIEDLTLAQGRQLGNELFDYRNGKKEIPDDIKTF
jgi:hypothetical protein